MKLKQTYLVALMFALPAFALAQESSPAKGSGCAKTTDCSELADIIRDFSKRTGKKFIIDPRVRAMGGITGVDVDKITYEQLIALATVHQFIFVPQGDITIVLPDAIARQQATPVYYDTSFKALDDEWVTLLLSGKNACTAYLVPILRPMMPQAAHLAANAQSNQMIITDRAVNARRIAQLFFKLDEASPAGRRCPDPDANMSKEWGKEPPPKK
jgi:type II secretory pathway component GspD/PulD (secretin)